ncbi:MAG: hypothetical protein Fur0021_40540 [Candidatus Promineifilaceae bacterium]
MSTKTTRPTTSPQPATKWFFVIWGGQLISLIGSGLTSFALSVWVYQSTGSATQLALVTLSFYVGIVVMSPLAGSLVDRWNKRIAMIISDSGAALSTLFIALLFWSGRLEIWHIYVSVAANAAFRSIQWPAYASVIARLVPKEQLGRANGLVQLGRGVGEIASPVLAGALLPLIQLQGVILVDFATFLFAVLTLALVRLPHLAATPAAGIPTAEPGERSLWREAAAGWRYMRQRPGLMGLLLFMSLIGFIYGMAQVLFIPLVLEFAAETTLGRIMSVGSLGMLVGGGLMSALGGPKRRVYGVLGPGFLMGAGLLLIGLRPQATLITVAMFLALFTVPIIAGSDEALWQSKVSPDIQGRVFALKNAATTAVLPLASLAAGPLADYVFEPLLVVDGPLNQSMGRVIGVGAGRGIGLLFMVLGLVVIFITIAALLSPRVRHVEDELPDAQPLLETATVASFPQTGA